MDKEIATFIKKFEKEIHQGTAAVFAGAGLSRSSGYANWKELIREQAEEINLDIDKEQDLISVAQYYKNERGGNRANLNKVVIEQFTKNTKNNLAMNILASLPIKTYWTTNYDHVIEDTLKNNENKKIDLKIVQENLANSVPDADAIVYKFHGDVSNPSQAILTKDDYEMFSITHKLFITALQGDLVSKTFVFIGYSFNDPDFLHILSCIRILLGENSRMHYQILKKIKKEDYPIEGTDEYDIEKYSYDKIKQELFIKDLYRYGIETILIDNYDLIPSIFTQIKNKNMARKIFVAGSCRNYGDWDKIQATKFMYELGYKLIEGGYSISTGMIEGVGPQIVNGVLTAINSNNLKLENYLNIKTLPLIDGSAQHMDSDSKKMFQNNMISTAGIVLFLFGNNYYGGKLEDSKGVMHDFERALQYNRYVIPVASTGFASKQIMDIIEKEMDRYPYLVPFIEDLKYEKRPEKLVELILRVVDSISEQNESLAKC